MQNNQTEKKCNLTEIEMSSTQNNLCKNANAIKNKTLLMIYCARKCI